MKTNHTSSSKNHDISDTHASAKHAGTTHASNAHHVGAHTEASPTPTSEGSKESPSVTVTATAVKATTTTAPAPTAATFLTPPPTDAHVPSPPPGFEPPEGANFRSVVPRGSELASSTNAIQDLQRFEATYTSILGATAPPFAHFLAGLTVASGWSSLRAESAAWDAYCATEEGLAWQAVRPMLDKFATAFELATDSNRSITTQFPGLSTLVGVRSAIAKKGASTRRLNKKAVAEGKQPFHGVAGKRRQRAAEKAAAAQQQVAQAQAPQTQVTPTSVPPSQPVVVAPPAGTGGPTNGVNGAAHS